MRTRFRLGFALFTFCLLPFALAPHAAHAQDEVHLPDGTVRPAGWPRVEPAYGGEGDIVRYIQYLLRARGAKIKITGTIDAPTESAIKNLQRRSHLKADGIVGDATWPRLVVKVQRGSRDDAVRALQLALRNGGTKIGVDGIFGFSTEAAVRAAQKRYGLPIDGIVGSITWCWLVGGTTPANTTTLY